MYENKTYVTDGFTHGCYWKSSGKFEYYNTDNLIHQNFETKMNHHHFSKSNRASSGVPPYSDSGGGGGGGATGGDSYYSTATPTAGGHPMDDGAYGAYNSYQHQQNHPHQPYQPNTTTTGSDSAIRAGRKLPNLGASKTTTNHATSAVAAGRNGKRQLPTVQGRSSSSLDNSDYSLASQSPVARKLPVPQRTVKSGSIGGQPPLIDNFNIDLSVKVSVLLTAGVLNSNYFYL